MYKAVTKEGPRAPLFYSAAALLLLSGKITTAQTVDFATLEHCAGLETQDRKIACFEAIIAGSKTAHTPETEGTEILVSEPPVAEIEAVSETEPPAEVMRQEAPAVDDAPGSTPAAVVTPTVAVAVTTEPPVEVMPQEEPAVDVNSGSAPAVAAMSTAALSVTPEPSAAAVATTPEPVANSQLGEEHLDRLETKEKANDEDEVFHATVIDVTKGRNRILYFHFDNGQIWRQNEVRHLEYPRSGEFDINITRGMMGDYRMRIGDNGRMVRIRRVE